MFNNVKTFMGKFFSIEDEWYEFYNNNRKKIKAALDKEPMMSELMINDFKRLIHSAEQGYGFCDFNERTERFKNHFERVSKNYDRRFVTYLISRFSRGEVPDPVIAQEYLAKITVQEQTGHKKRISVEERDERREKIYYSNRPQTYGGFYDVNELREFKRTDFNPNHVAKTGLVKDLLGKLELDNEYLRKGLEQEDDSCLTLPVEDGLRAMLIHKAHECWKKKDYMKAFDIFEGLNNAILDQGKIGYYDAIMHFSKPIIIGEGHAITIKGDAAKTDEFIPVITVQKPFINEQIMILEDMIAPEVRVSEGELIIEKKPAEVIAKGKKLLEEINSIKRAINHKRFGLSKSEQEKESSELIDLTELKTELKEKVFPNLKKWTPEAVNNLLCECGAYKSNHSRHRARY